MKIIVFSDSHGSYFNMDRVVKMHSDADYFFHLGDGLNEFNLLKENYNDKAFVGVEGNMDGFNFTGSRAVSEITLDIEGYRFFLTHGHKYGVKRSLDVLISAGRQRKADVILYGHTHIPFCDYLNFEDKPVRILCPGSIERPCESLPTYAIIEIRNGSMLAYCTKLDYLGN